MPSSIDALWRALESQERRTRTPAFPAPLRDAIWFEDWRARLNRVERIRGALFLSGSVTSHLVAERLSGIDISMVSEILLSACKDVALVWGGSVLLGGAAGGAIGFFGFGAGAIPGAVAGAGVGTQVGAWVLGMLGLKALVEDLGTAIPQALRHYEEGFRLAWGPVQRWESDPGSERAPHELAQGHVVLTIAMLSALTAYLTRGRGDPGAKARILQEIRESPRLGAKVADWVIANEDRLRAHPALRPKQQQVTMASAAAKDTSQPATPSQLRRQNDDTTSNGTHPSARTPAEPRGGQVAETPSTGNSVSGLGPRVVRATGKVDESEVARLTDDVASGGKSRPAEARAAAELQNVMGGRLDRAPEGSSYDFRFVDGPNKGKSVDFMYTTSQGKQSEIDGMNWHIANNPEKAYLKLDTHLGKADYVPLDYRNLTSSNQALLDAYIKTLPVAKQSQFILFK